MEEEFEFSLDELIDNMVVNVKEDIKDFSSLVNLKSSLNREITLGDINDGTGDAVDAFINFWNEYDEQKGIPVEDRKPIKLYIDSNGGSLIDTLIIIDSIRLSKTPVIGICIGTAYSGGFFTLISCDKRLAYPHASFLFHEGATQTGGTSGQFENYTEFYKKQLKQLKEIVLNNTKITEEEYEKIKREDIWYDAKEALEKGIIDEIKEPIK
jgi:ATP-dependent Clp protease protease subunit